MVIKNIYLTFLCIILSKYLFAQSDSDRLIKTKQDLELIKIQNKDYESKIIKNKTSINKLTNEGNNTLTQIKTTKFEIDSLTKLINRSLLNGTFVVDNEDSIAVIKKGISDEINVKNKNIQIIKNRFNIKSLKQKEILDQTKSFSESIEKVTSYNILLADTIEYFINENNRLDTLEKTMQRMSAGINQRTSSDFDEIINDTSFLINKPFVLNLIGNYLSTRQSDLQSSNADLIKNYIIIGSLKKLIISSDSIDQFMNTMFDYERFQNLRELFIELSKNEGFKIFHKNKIYYYLSLLEKYCTQFNRLAFSFVNNAILLKSYDLLQRTPNDGVLTYNFKQNLAPLLKDRDLMNIPYIKTLLTNAYADHRKLTKTEMEFLKNYKTDFNCNNKN
jgi:hypothetical protein